MSSTTVAPTAGPKPLPTGKYVAVVLGMCVLIAVVGASAAAVCKEMGIPEESSGWIVWAVAFAVLMGMLIPFARKVGNPTAWIVAGALFGMSAMHAGEEGGKLAGGWWVAVGKHSAVFAGYLLWILAIHPRLAGRPNPPVGAGASERGA